MPRIRTLKEAAAELKAKDPETAITEYALRRLVKSGKLPHVLAGRKYLINMQVLESYLNGELLTA